MPSTLYNQARENGFAPRELKLPPFVLYCSTVEIRKNHLLLARTWKRALDEGRTLPMLCCAGRWGWGVDELATFIDEHPDLRACIRFLGPVPDEELVALYRNALFGVYPSFLEGWGLGASEALDFGLPVIISTADALREATCGLMPAIDPCDEDGWYRTIAEWADNPTLVDALRRKIADDYRPVAEIESWNAIKQAIRTTAG